MEAILFPLVSISYVAWIGASAILGVVLGLLWECFRILRRAFAHNGLSVALEDLVFFLLAYLGYWIVCYSYAMGYVRWFSLSALFLGFALYLATLGRLLTRWSQGIIDAVARLLFWGKRRVVLPLAQGLLRLLRWLFSPIRYVFFRLLAYREKKLRQRAVREFLKRSSRGFST